MIRLLAVSAFTKKSGDYYVLSATDLKLLALTYELEVEACNGSTEHLRMVPLRLPNNITITVPATASESGSERQRQETNEDSNEEDANKEVENETFLNNRNDDDTDSANEDNDGWTEIKRKKKSKYKDDDDNLSMISSSTRGKKREEVWMKWEKLPGWYNPDEDKEVISNAPS